MAGLYPVGIIVAALEVRALRGVPRVRQRGGIHSRASAGYVAGLGLPAFLAMPFLVQSVASGVTLKGWLVLAVALAGWALWMGVLVLLIEFIAMAWSWDTPTGGVATDSAPSPRGETKSDD